MLAIRTAHLRQLAHLAAPGGATIQITDVASSDTLPAPASMPAPALVGLLPRLAAEGSFFHGANPEALRSLAARDPVLSADLAGPETAPPGAGTSPPASTSSGPSAGGSEPPDLAPHR